MNNAAHADNSQIRMIAGLGNPGSDYAHTRHNAGFDVVDALCRALPGVSEAQSECSGLMRRAQFRGRTVLILKPQTYMNLSGDSVEQAARKYALETQEIMVIYDDLALELGQLRMRAKGSGGSHNGMNHVIQRLNSGDVPRLRVGIGNDFSRGKQVDFVLSAFEGEEKDRYDAVIDRAVDALKLMLARNLNVAMNACNGYKPAESPEEKPISIQTISNINPLIGGPNIEQV